MTDLDAAQNSELPVTVGTGITIGEAWQRLRGRLLALVCFTVLEAAGAVALIAVGVFQSLGIRTPFWAAGALMAAVALFALSVDGSELTYHNVLLQP